MLAGRMTARCPYRGRQTCSYPVLLLL